MKKSAPILICVLVFLLGLTIMFYPTVSNWVQEQNASYVITNYQEKMDTKTKDEALALFQEAKKYNSTITGNKEAFKLAEENNKAGNQDELYWNTFDDLNGIIGVVEAPTIDVNLPIYHGTNESVLQKGVGHLEGSALPTGEIGDHTVLTGHTGLPSAYLFTDLDQLCIGDTFNLKVLNKTFTYEISDINVVLPSETKLLEPQRDKSLATLITCTPYGVNSHRLFVTGNLIDTKITELSDTPIISQNNSSKNNALHNLPLLIGVSAIALLVLIAVIIIVINSRKKIGVYKPKHTKVVKAYTPKHSKKSVTVKI